MDRPFVRPGTTSAAHDYNGELLLKLPKSYEALEDEDEKLRVRTEVEISIFLWTYETEPKNANPILHDILRTKQGRTRRDTVEFSANTWDGDIVPFRQCLIRIARYVAPMPATQSQYRPLTHENYSHWNEINSETPCPIKFTDEEIKELLQDGEGWNENADFWDSPKGFGHHDGWTSNENYEQALEMFAQLREQGLQNLSGEERSTFEERTRWRYESLNRSDIVYFREIYEQVASPNLNHHIGSQRYPHAPNGES
jgi:hypothetical protein